MRPCGPRRSRRRAATGLARGGLRAADGRASVRSGHYLARCKRFSEATQQLLTPAPAPCMHPDARRDTMVPAGSKAALAALLFLCSALTVSASSWEPSAFLSPTSRTRVFRATRYPAPRAAVARFLQHKV